MFLADATAELTDLQRSVVAFCATFDADSVALPDAASVWRTLDQIERRIAGSKALLARRVEEAGAWRQQGDRSAAHYLARAGGSTVGAAKGVLETSRRLAALPTTAEAMRSGELSLASRGGR